MLVVDRPGESPAIDAAIALSDDAVAPDIVRPQGRQLGRRIWSATWPKLAAIGLGLAIWQIVVWTGWRPEYALPAPATVFERLGELIADGTVLDALVVTGRRAAAGFALALVIGVAVGCRRGLIQDRPIGRRVDDHRSADDAVDRLVPAGDPAVPAVGGGDPLRRRARRRAVDRQRADLRHRSRPAGAPAGRPDDGGTRAAALPPRRAAGVVAILRRWPEAGVGVRLAQPDGWRAARDVGRVLASASCSSSTGTSTMRPD